MTGNPASLLVLRFACDSDPSISVDADVESTEDDEFAELADDAQHHRLPPEPSEVQRTRFAGYAVV